MNQWTSCFLWALMFLSQVQLVAPMPGIEKFLFLADNVANITTYATEIGLEGEAPEVKVLDQTQIEPRVIDSNPILTFLDICNNVRFVNITVCRLKSFLLSLSGHWSQPTI